MTYHLAHVAPSFRLRGASLRAWAFLPVRLAVYPGAADGSYAFARGRGGCRFVECSMSPAHSAEPVLGTATPEDALAQELVSPPPPPPPARLRRPPRPLTRAP